MNGAAGRSDFFTRLAERATSAAPQLERRPRGLFEPEAPRTASGDPGVEGVEHIAAPPVTVGPVAVERVVRVHEPFAVRATAPLSVEAGPRTTPVPPPSPEPLRAHQPARASLTDHAPIPTKTLVPAVPTPIAAPPLQQTAEMPAPIVPGTARPQAVANVGPVARHAPDQAPEAKAPAASSRRDSGEKGERPAPAPRPVEPSTPSAPALARPKTLRENAPAVLIARAQAKAGPVPAPAQPAPPPPVQISIGRVEVRAQHAVEPRPRAQAQGSPRLKLEDYLRQRSGGGSR